MKRVQLAPDTEARLRRFLSLALSWNARIAIMSKQTDFEAAWERHVVDSVQILPLLPSPADASNLGDFGSGAGFPGLVLALMEPERHVTLFESDRRKAAFLIEVAREFGLQRVRVETRRIEICPNLGCAIVTARALAPLPELLCLADRHLRKGGTAVFHKGGNAESEIAKADRDWSMTVERFTSVTDSTGTILRVSDIRRRSA